MHLALKLSLQVKLSRKYEITEIPTLVMLNAKNGQLLTVDGKVLILKDPDGARFPWNELDFLVKANCTNQDNELVTWDSIADKCDVVGLYFSVSIIIINLNLIVLSHANTARGV